MVYIHVNINSAGLNLTLIIAGPSKTFELRWPRRDPSAIYQQNQPQTHNNNNSLWPTLPIYLRDLRGMNMGRMMSITICTTTPLDGELRVVCIQFIYLYEWRWFWIADRTFTIGTTMSTYMRWVMAWGWENEEARKGGVMYVCGASAIHHRRQRGTHTHTRLCDSI